MEYPRQDSCSSNATAQQKAEELSTVWGEASSPVGTRMCCCQIKDKSQIRPHVCLHAHIDKLPLALEVQAAVLQQLLLLLCGGRKRRDREKQRSPAIATRKWLRRRRC